MGAPVLLTIRKPQLDALREVALQGFIRELVADARRRFARYCVGKTDAQLVELVRDGIAKAQALRIEEREDLVLFASLVIAHGLAFDERPELSWTRALLTSDLEAGTRLSILFDRLPQRLQPDFVPPGTA